MKSTDSDPFRRSNGRIARTSIWFILFVQHIESIALVSRDMQKILLATFVQCCIHVNCSAVQWSSADVSLIIDKSAPDILSVTDQEGKTPIYSPVVSCFGGNFKSPQMNVHESMKREFQMKLKMFSTAIFEFL